MDNIFILHEDKVFLRLMTELAVMHLARDWKLQINKSWNIQRTCDGIDFCGQRIFADHALLRKRTKHDLCAQVAKLRKRGYSDEQIRIKAASRLGLTRHANCINLLNKIGMKKYGQLVKTRKGVIPFEGMSMQQKKHPEDILCRNIEEYDSHIILIEDYKVDKSKVDFAIKQVEEVDEQGNKNMVSKKVPKDRLAIKFRYIDYVEKKDELDENGDAIEVPHWKPEHWWLFTGSEIMVDQAKKEWPLLGKDFYVVAAELTNKFGKKFYKFI